MSLKAMPTVFTFALVDVVSEDMSLSRGKARKAILRGKVYVGGKVVLDPHMRVNGEMKIMFKP
jgi:predicted rRNA methylase YqxC with S4 and FtsJ domains